MKRLCFFLPVVIASCVLVFAQVGLGQESIGQSPQPAQPKHHRHIPIFRNADEFTLSSDVESYEPLDGFSRQNRDIDLQVASVALDFFLRAGGGVAVRVSPSYWIESTFHWAHISNGAISVHQSPLG